MTLLIATGRYFDRKLIERSELAPVSVTVGQPKFPLGYELAGHVGMLAPYGLLKIEEIGAFRDAYFERLERYGPAKVKRVLAAIAHSEGRKGVVLLCFEDLTKPDEWCHRRVFAEWWLAETGDQVLELHDLLPDADEAA